MNSKRIVKWGTLVLLLVSMSVAAIPGTADEPQAEPSAITCGDVADCTLLGPAVEVINHGAGAAIRGRSVSARIGVLGIGQPGVRGTSGNGTGVEADSTSGYGLKATSGTSTAVWAQGFAIAPDVILAGNSVDFNHGIISSDPSRNGEFQIWSYSNLIVELDENNNDASERFLVHNGANSTIFEAQADGDVVVGHNMLVNNGMVLGGDIQVGDDQGYGSIMAYGTTGADLYLFANDSIYADLDQDQNSSNSCFRIRNGANDVVWSQCESKGTTTVGSQAVAVETSSGTREMYALGSPGVWFEDFGSAALVDGQATVTIDPLFAETVSLEAEYHVYLTPVSSEAVLLFVTAKTPAAFEVQGVTLDGSPASASFDYRIVAKRLGYESQRLEQVDLAPPEEEAP